MGITTDYLVVGAGLSGLAFIDTLVTESPEATVVVVDRNHAPGGHWLHAYDFVRLHSPSWFYGVHSLHLGEDKRDHEGLNKGLYERATKAELLAYFATVAERLRATGRVQFLFSHSATLSGEVRSARGDVVDLEVRRAFVDARYLESSVPATHVPSYDVAAEAAFVPVGGLPAAVDSADGFVVLGSGKTAADACLWLLEDARVDPGRVRWVRPRDAWWHDRRLLQGLELLGATMEGLANDAEALVSAASISDLQDRLEQSGNLVRLDPTAATTMYRGGMLSAGEVRVLRRVTDVVRLGHAVRVERDRIVLNGGAIDTGPGVLVVDCTARGVRQAPPVPIWSDGRITLQAVRHNSPPFSAALLGWVEAHRSGEADRNRLCPPNPYASSIADYPRLLTRTWQTEAAWISESDLMTWVSGSRLNLLRGLPEQQGEPEVQAATNRLLGNVFAAIENAPRVT